MEPELFYAPISVLDSRLSLNCDCKRGRINEVTMMDEIGDSLNQRKKMEPELFDVPISVSDSRLSLNCDCRRRRINEVTIMDLPAAIMVEILTKLPINMIFRCKFVCKSWYKLITSDPLFVNIPIILDRNLHLPHPVDLVSEDKANLTLIGSCNGFICLLNGETHVVKHSVCISNPLLGEYFKVKLPEWEKRIRHIHYGFCFSEASGQYKVLRLVTRKFRGHPDVSELEVYTLGVDEKNWRNVGKAPKPVQGKLSDANVNEEVKSLPAPSGLKSPSLYLMLAVTELGNCLCLSVSRSFHYMDIWWMKEYGIAGSWTRDRISVTLPVSYNPKEQIFRNVVNVYGSGTEATRYIPSFYSLKTVMGDNFQISNAYRRT
ncbi:hypothetical protein KY289_023403 [Solanum tuberosum]|nr:hypothetical protein KY289_023403 [Solanum tuberosum]